MNLVKIRKWLISLANFNLLVSIMDFIFAHFVFKESFGQFWGKLTE